ncbi:protein kinase [Actinoplanes sp. NPDC024001]|uniref:serine/threonine-protein kinase n=1 Tax=Actinoplanes sp. NPDC024001 TaxID=3154598 RepID=UPI0033C64939
MLSPGIVLNGRYQLTQRIAAGGMGEVWRGSDLLLHREIAVKVLLPALMADQEFITRFRTEARMMAALRHPGIVQVYDYGENAAVGNDSLDYLVMEYIEGTPLAKRIQQAGRLGPAETMTLVAQVAEALQTAHEAGIIHRDVKPSNLLVRPAGAIVLVDFGVARSVGVTGITSTNVVMGSAHYMAPEQAEGRPVSAATDVYALGAVAFSCLAGRPPYVGDNPLAVLAQLVHGQPPVMPEDVPPAVGAVVLRALAREPGQRFPSAAALAEAARAAASAPASVRPASGVYGSAVPGRPGAAFGSARPGQPGAVFGSAAPGQPGAAFGSAAPGQAAFGAAVFSPGDASAQEAKRRRKKLLAVVAGAAVLALGGTGVVLANQSSGGGSQAQIQQPSAQAAGQDVPVREEAPAAEPSKSKGGKTAKPNGTTRPSSPAPAGGRSVQPGTTTTPTDAATTPPAPEPGTTATTGTPTTEPTTAPTTTPPGAEPTQPYTAAQVCGSGYQVIDSAALKASGAVKGRVYLLYQASSGKNCVVTLKTTSVGEKTATTAYLEVKGKSRVTDSGSFAYYAGPVRAAAAATCVKWGGSVGTATYASPFEHCD